MIKRIVAILLVIMVLSVAVFSETNLRSIEVVLNDLNLSLNSKSVAEKGESFVLDNGNSVPFSILYEGTTYLPVKKLSELLGASVGWDGTTRTVDLSLAGQEASPQTLAVKGAKAQNAIIDLSDVDYKNIRAGSLYMNGSYQVLDYEVNGSEFTIKSTLPVGQSAILEFYTGNGKIQVKVEDVIISDLYSGEQTTNGGATVVRIPAMPDKGFNFDFLVAVRTHDDIRNSNEKKHIFLEMINTGSVKSRTEFEAGIDYNRIMGSSYISYNTAFDLGMPVVYPLIPRLQHSINTPETGRATFYMHSLDRDSMYYKEVVSGDMYGSSVGNDLADQIVKSGYGKNDFDDIDEQILAMVDYAREYLAANDVKTEEKVFISGYSASGSFTERFTALHPDRVRASAAGGSGDDFIMPVETLKGKDLMYPVGVSDYNKMTDRTFDMASYNNVAKIVYMGKDDENNVVPFGDCYGDDERDIIIDLWGEAVLPRALAMFKDYETTDDKALFLLDVGVEHGISNEMRDYVVEFFRANRGDDTQAVYPAVKASNLEEYRYLD